MPVEPPDGRVPAADLLYEPRLADAGVPGHEEERSPALRDPLHQMRDGRQLPLPADQRADTAPGGGFLRLLDAFSEQPPPPHRTLLALERQLTQRREVEPASREPVGELAHVGLPRRGHGLESLGQVHRVPENRIVTDLPAEHPGDDPPRVDPHMKPETRGLGREFRECPGELGMHTQGDHHCPDGVILQRHRRAEDDEQGVPGVLGHVPAQVLRHRRQPGDERADDLVQLVGIEPVGQRGEAREVGEHGADQTALLH